MPNFIGAKDDGVVVTTGNLQCSSQILITNKPTPNFLQAGCLCCRPTNSVRALKAKNKKINKLVPPELTTMAQHNFIPTAPSIWNNLPEDTLTNCETIIHFVVK